VKLLLWAILLFAAFAGATLWRAGQQERQAEAAYPPEGDFVTVDDHRVHYVVMGDGPDLVLIHGASGNTRDYTFEMAGRLADRSRVFVLDRPGLGYTDRIDPEGASLEAQAGLLADAAIALGAQSPIVFGHSYGGAVGLAWALYRPDQISALVASASVANPWDTGLGTYYTVLSHPLGRRFLIPMLTAWVSDTVVDDQIDAVFQPQTAPEGYHAYIGAGLTLRRSSMRANALHRRNLLRDIRLQAPRYGEIAIPVEILHGDADTTVPLSVHAEPLSRQLQDATLTALPGVGHMLHHADPEATDAAIDRVARRAGLAP